MPDVAAKVEGDQPLKVFIVGPARSGTSILFFALRQVLELPGFGESHVMPVFQKVINDFRVSFRKFRDIDEDLLVKKLTREEFEPYIFVFIRNFYFRAHGSESWVDKTPADEAVHGLALIETIFPDARILATKRTGIEVVSSYIRKFASTFEEACAVWVNSMEGIKSARGFCKNVMEIDQYDVANHPYDTAKRIASHLARAECAEKLGQFLGHETVEKSSTHDPQRRLTLADMEWSAEQKNYFVEHCGKTMDAFGYTM